MKKVLLIVGAVVAVLAIAITCIGIYAVRSPEYALLKIVKDVRASGMDGLRPHLTENAQQTLDAVSLLSDSGLVGAIMDLFAPGDYVGVLKSELQNTQWSLEDISKSGAHAAVTVRFNYDDRLVGTVVLSMLRQDGAWKIDGLELPKFDKISLN